MSWRKGEEVRGRACRRPGFWGLTLSHPVAGAHPLPMQSQENRMSPKCLPAGTFCGSQQRWANKIRCGLLFSSHGHILSISMRSGT